MDSALETYLRRLKERPRVDFEDDGSLEGMDPGDRDGSLSPKPLALQERPTFGNMLDGNAFQAIRTDADWDRRGNDREADLLAEAGGQRLLDGRQPVAGLRAALPAGRGMPADEGSGGPMGYLDALRRAQRMDDLSAAVGRSNAAMQQLAGITSRGAFQPHALPPMPSEVSKEAQRRAAVAEYLKQQRDAEDSAQNNAFKRWMMGRKVEPKPQPAADPLLDDKRLKIQNEAEAAKALAEARRRLPPGRATKADKPTRDMAGEKQAEYERRLKEGIPAGYELAPGAQPTTKQREEAAKIVISRGMVDDSINQVRELLKSPGAVANPRVRDLLAQQGQFIQTQLRVLEDLGVPSGPDAKILETLIGSPASLVGEALDTTQQKLDALGKYVGKRVDTTASTYGLQRKQAGQTLTPEERKELEELRARKAEQAKGVK